MYIITWIIADTQKAYDEKKYKQTNTSIKPCTLYAQYI